MDVTSFLTQVTPQKGIINFGIGQPQPALLPLEELRQASQHRLAFNDTDLLNYGYEGGDGRFREALAQFLTPNYGAQVNPDELLVTGGASHALDMLCTLYTQAGDTVLVEKPTYFLVYKIFEDHHLNIVEVPIRNGGYDFEALETAVKRYNPKFFYTIPTFQNPATHCIPFEQKEELVALSQAHNFLIVADEVYQLLDYTQKPSAPLANLIGSETVLSIGSFSKILAPGLRVGWIHGAAPHIKKLTQSGLLISGGGINHFTTNLVTSVLTLGLQTSYLIKLKQIYGRRVDLMDALLKEHFGPSAKSIYTKPAGGYFFWLKLGDHVDTAMILQQAQKRKVGFHPGNRFCINQSLPNYLRLSFAYYEDQELRSGLAQLLPLLPKI